MPPPGALLSSAFPRRFSRTRRRRRRRRRRHAMNPVSLVNVLSHRESAAVPRYFLSYEENLAFGATEGITWEHLSPLLARD